MNLSCTFKSWRQYRATMTELNRLSQRELDDLGISRSDIPALARKTTF